MNQPQQAIPIAPGTNYPLDPLKLPRESWRPSDASALRHAPRTVEREIERIPAWIRSRKRNEWVPVRIWDYSTFGFGILYQPGGIASEFSVPGDRIELRLGGLGGKDAQPGKSFQLPCLIENATRVEKGMRIGLSRLDLLPFANGEQEPEFPPGYLQDTIRPVTAKVLNPYLYKEWSEARMVGIGPKATMVFESSDAGLLLLGGARVTLDIELPLDSQGKCTGSIAWIRAGLAGRVLFAIHESDLSFDLSNAIGEHFVQAELCKPSGLSDFGLRLKRFKDQTRFRFVSTQEEYEAILKLRKDAYAKAGKASPHADPDPIATAFDSHSRLLAAFHGDQLVASVALSFAGAEGTTLRTEGCFPGAEFPVRVPPKDSIMEVISLCTDSDYRGGDLIQGMFEQIARCMLFSDRKWILTFTTAKLWPLYRRIGFKKVGASVLIKELGNLEHHLILLHRNSLIAGVRMRPFAWNYFFGSLVRELIERGHLQLGSWLKARVAFYSLFSGFTRKWLDAGLEREFRELLQKRISMDGKDDR